MNILNEMHRQLCVCFEVVEEVLVTLETAGPKVTLAVLLDDLDDLIEEGEQLIIAGVDIPQDEFSSFFARSATVIDEVKDFFRQ